MLLGLSHGTFRVYRTIWTHLNPLIYKCARKVNFLKVWEIWNLQVGVAGARLTSKLIEGKGEETMIKERNILQQLLLC